MKNRESCFIIIEDYTEQIDYNRSNFSGSLNEISKEVEIQRYKYESCRLIIIFCECIFSA